MQQTTKVAPPKRGCISRLAIVVAGIVWIVLIGSIAVIVNQAMQLQGTTPGRRDIPSLPAICTSPSPALPVNGRGTVTAQPFDCATATPSPIQQPTPAPPTPAPTRPALRTPVPTRPPASPTPLPRRTPTPTPQQL
ncbi:MAG TPA: hypothetical protein VFB60_12990 [Ktedonobacteraceae bacterium]|nr:hypothetical protein [Ktedonobacteraceae bacterium]